MSTFDDKVSIQTAQSIIFFLGYWSGLIPRAIGELTCVGLTYAIAHIVNAYVLEDKALKAWTQQLASFFASSITYPFQVT